jgi:hypothetical protein
MGEDGRKNRQFKRMSGCHQVMNAFVTLFMGSCVEPTQTIGNDSNIAQHEVLDGSDVNLSRDVGPDDRGTDASTTTETQDLPPDALNEDVNFDAGNELTDVTCSNVADCGSSDTELPSGTDVMADWDELSVVDTPIPESDVGGPTDVDVDADVNADTLDAINIDSASFDTLDVGPEEPCYGTTAVTCSYKEEKGGCFPKSSVPATCNGGSQDCPLYSTCVNGKCVCAQQGGCINDYVCDPQDGQSWICYGSNLQCGGYCSLGPKECVCNSDCQTGSYCKRKPWAPAGYCQVICCGP